MNDLEREAVERALNTLAEHFEVAQVFVQVHRGEDHTDGYEAGFGNFFARQMQIHRWYGEQVLGSGQVEVEPEDEDE